MDFGMEAGIFLAYTAGLMMIYLFGKLLLVPFKILLRLLVNSIAGGVALMLINIAGGIFGLALPVNILTSLFAGTLGIPGILGMLIYFNIF